MDKLKILIVSTNDISGGAARATFRFHKALLSRGVDSKMLVQSKLSDDYKVVGPKNKKQKFLYLIKPIFNAIPNIFYKNKTKTLFNSQLMPFCDISNIINKINPDIVHLHWVCSGMVSISEIKKIKSPIVWTLFDMWPFTGGCHYDEHCFGYEKKCGNCKVLKSDRKNDLSRIVWKTKKKNFEKIKNLTVIGHSAWLSKCASSSSLFKERRVLNIPSVIDTDYFNIINKKIAKEILKLPLDKKIITFGAMNAVSDPRKGFEELKKSFDFIKDETIELVVFGSTRPEKEENFGFKINYLGNLNDDISLKLLYNASDVVIVPSIQENLSNIIMESLSCGTPVVAFDIGGNKDMIEHCKNGYLAKPFLSEDLAAGIMWVLYNKNYDVLSKNARKKIEYNFSYSNVDKYIDVYNSIKNEKS